MSDFWVGVRDVFLLWVGLSLLMVIALGVAGHLEHRRKAAEREIPLTPYERQQIAAMEDQFGGRS